MSAAERTCELLEEHFDAIARAMTDRTFAAHPELVVRYGRIGYQRCSEDSRFHLRYLAEALGRGRPSLFADYVAWAKVMLAERHVPAEDLRANLRQMIEVIRETLPAEDAAPAIDYIERALEPLAEYPTTLLSQIDPDAPLAGVAAQFLQALLAGDRRAAQKIVVDAIADGASIRDIYLFVFQQSQREVGRLWQANKITVAHEHLATAATQAIMSTLHPEIFRTERIGRTFVGACVDGELHEIGMRMVADFFEMEGWDTYYLGANTPKSHLVQLLAERKADVLGISATITYHIRAVEEIIRAVRETPATRDVKILVGGYPFNREPGLWKEVGADGFARDASESIALGHEFVR